MIEAFRLEKFIDGGGAQVDALFLEGGTDLINRTVLFAQGDSVVTRGALLGLALRTPLDLDKIIRLRITPEMMAHDLEGTGRVSKRTCDFGHGFAFDEEGPHGFVLALPWSVGAKKKIPAFSYGLWLSDRHIQVSVHEAAGQDPRV